MNNAKIERILERIRQGKKCYWGIDEDEFSTVVSIEHNGDDTFQFTSSISHKYDVVSPAQYDNKILDEDELRALLHDLPDETLNSISYVDTNVINENTREKVDLIYSYLGQGPRTVYVVFKEARRPNQEGEAPRMNFNSLFKNPQQAQQMADYLLAKQGARCYWKEIRLTLNGDEIELSGESSEYEQVNARQILVTLLDMDTEQIATFFEG